MDVLFFSIGDEFLARKDWMTLDLVDGGDDASLLDQSLQVLVGEVRYTNRANLALGELVDSLPRLTVRYGVVDVNLVGVGSGREQVRVRIISWPKVDGPVDKVEVKVVKFELCKCVIQCGLDMLGVVLCVPEFGRD